MIPPLDELKRDIYIQKELRGFPLKLFSTWGLFSPKDVDAGTELLLHSVEIAPDAVSLDLGCGYGAIGITLAKLSPSGHVHMIDKDYVAVEYARKNAKINNLKNFDAYLSNGFEKVPEGITFDVIVSNLPAKVSKELFLIMLLEAKNHLKPGGKFYVVTISGLKEFIKRNFQEVFGNYEKVAHGKTYTVSLARKE